MSRGMLFVMSGPSGTGKGTICGELLKREDIFLSVSSTTREIRKGETDGVTYNYTTVENFKHMIDNGEMLEYAVYNGNYYGTPRAYVEQQLEAGKDVVLEIEIQGALKIKEKFPTALLLFVMPPSAEELRKRLTGRGTETQEIIDQRMHRAIEEAQGIEQYDYIVINDQLEECVKELHALIGAAHNTPSRNEEFINNMREELKTI